MKRILMTGAAGRIGQTLRQGLRAEDRVLRLVDKRPLGDAAAREELVEIDATDLPALETAMKDVDVVIHLAAVPEEGPWEEIFPLNYVLTHNTFEAARRAQVSRVVYASSIQAVGFHPIAEQLDGVTRLRPSGFYGVSKAFGEALASLYADKHGLSVACLRIATFEDKPTDKRMLATWLSPADAVHLFDRCIEAQYFRFFSIYGVSANTRRMVDNSHVDWLGYSPVSNAEQYRDEIERLAAPLGPLAQVTHGGGFCDVGFDAEIDAILATK